MKRCFCSWMFTLLLSWAGLYAPKLSAHRYSMSLATVQANSLTGKIEVMIQLFNHDLDPFLTSLCEQEKASAVLQSCDAESLLQSYTRRRFRILDKAVTKRWQWVGVDRRVHHSYVFLELDLESGWRSWQYKHDLLTEFYPKQLNRVDLR